MNLFIVKNAEHKCKELQSANSGVKIAIPFSLTLACSTKIPIKKKQHCSDFELADLCRGGDLTEDPQ